MIMASKGKQFGQRRPPLSVTIKQILERYPDGQIFKEMIQNADDAGATVIQFYVDCRQHGTSGLVKPELAAYQGPALISANDAMFSEQDWEGIQSLQQSIKADDPFKVGRFGIGFNSVYHLTGEEKALQFASIEDLPVDSALLVTQINSAANDEELNRLFQDNNDLYCEVFQRCGITQVLKLKTRDIIGQEIVLYDSIGRLSKLLDQICDGLRTLGLLSVIRAFPELFFPLFTVSANLSADDVAKAIYIGETTFPQDDVTIGLLKRWISGASEESLRQFLLHTTGMTIPYYKSIRVEFMDEDTYGAITAHTCSRVISFPRGLDSFENFSLALEAVITSQLSYNTV